MGKRQSTEFKLNAVDKALNRHADETLEQVAQQLGIGYSTLTRWMTHVSAGALTPPLASPERRPQSRTNVTAEFPLPSANGNIEMNGNHGSHFKCVYNHVLPDCNRVGLCKSDSKLYKIEF